MNEVKLVELTDEERKQYDDKCAEIAARLKFVKVYAVVFINPENNKRVACYLSEPNYITKLYAMNKAGEQGLILAAEDLRNACTIKDESDSLTHGDAPQCDAYKLGVCRYIITNMVTSYEDQYKKK